MTARTVSGHEKQTVWICALCLNWKTSCTSRTLSTKKQGGSIQLIKHIRDIVWVKLWVPTHHLRLSKAHNKKERNNKKKKLTQEVTLDTKWCIIVPLLSLLLFFVNISSNNRPISGHIRRSFQGQGHESVARLPHARSEGLGGGVGGGAQYYYII